MVLWIYDVTVNHVVTFAHRSFDMHYYALELNHFLSLEQHMVKSCDIEIFTLSHLEFHTLIFNLHRF